MSDQFPDLPNPPGAASDSRPTGLTSRRGLLRAAGAGTLSAGAVALLAGCDSIGARRAHAKDTSPSKDVATLNYALGLEHEAIDIYQIAAESGLIKGGLLKTAVQFQGHHKGHRDALAATVAKLAGSPGGREIQGLLQVAHRQISAAECAGRARTRLQARRHRRK